MTPVDRVILQEERIQWWDPGQGVRTIVAMIDVPYPSWIVGVPYSMIDGWHHNLSTVQGIAHRIAASYDKLVGKAWIPGEEG